MTKLHRCVECNETSFITVEVPDTIVLDGMVYKEMMPASKCAKCGEVYFDGPVLEERCRKLATHLLTLNDIGPEAMKFIVKQHKLDRLLEKRREPS